MAKSLFALHAEAACLPVSPASPLYRQALADTLEYAPQTMEEQLEEAAGPCPAARGPRAGRP